MFLQDRRSYPVSSQRSLTCHHFTARLELPFPLRNWLCIVWKFIKSFSFSPPPIFHLKPGLQTNRPPKARQSPKCASLWPPAKLPFYCSTKIATIRNRHLQESRRASKQARTRQHRKTELSVKQTV